MSAPRGRRSGLWRTRVQWDDTDGAGIHHNSAVGRWAEAAEAELAREAGLPGYFLAAPRVRYEADFEAPLHFGQDVTAEVWVERAGTSSLTLAFEVWGGAYDGRPRARAASGRYVVVHIGGTRGSARPQASPWPDGWVEALTGGS